MRRKKVIVPLIIAGLALVAIPFLLNGQSSDTTTQQQTSVVTTGTLTSTITGSGNLYVDSTTSITPEVSGEVKNLKVSLGDTVKKGQTLFTIDDDGDLDTAVTKAAASVTQAKQSLENARTQLLQAQQDLTDANERHEEKADTVSASEIAILNQKIVAAQASVDTSSSNVTIAQNEYTKAKSNALKRTVTAPQDGTITTLNIKNGDSVGSTSNSTSASSAILTIDNLSTLKAKISLNEVDAIAAKAGQKVSLTFDAVEDLTLTGKLDTINVTVTVTQGVVTYDATVTLDNQDARLRPQMTTTATITTDVRQNVVKVPTTAIKTNNNDSYVMVMENGQSRQQTVTLGISSDSDTEITAGLSAGQTIVVSTVSTSTSSSSNGQAQGGRQGGLGMPGIF